MEALVRGRRALGGRRVRARVLIFAPKDAEPGDPVIPKRVEALKVPPTADVMKGRAVYLKRCWMCHGDAGQGDGPARTTLVPPPANFTVDEFDKMPDGELFWKVTVGIGNTAMPQWGMLLAEEDRWNAIYYVKRTFIGPSEPEDVSDELPVQYQALTSPYADTPDARAAGRSSTARSARDATAPRRSAMAPYGAPLMPTPANLAEDPALTSPAEWWYWRVDQGVVGFDGGDEKNLHPTAMPAWRFILNDQQKWNVIYYTRDLIGAKDAEAGH